MSSTHAEDTPELAAIMRAAASGALAKVHTAIPAKIVSYDAATQRAVVQPAIQGKFRAPGSEEVINVELPKIARVPVAFPSAAGFSITWPLSVGDPVTLIFAERSLDEWLTTGNDSNTAADPRRFDLSDAIAIPGGRPFNDPIPAAGVEAGVMVVRATMIKLGSASASDFVALASKVEAQLARIEAAMVAALAIPLDGGVGLQASFLVALTVPGPFPASTAATKVKAE